MSRQALDRAAGLLGFDELPSAPPRRLRVLWLENKLDCNTWSYYCDIRAAMAALHDLCSPSPRTTCLSDGFEPDVAVAGPRFTINIPTLATPCQKRNGSRDLREPRLAVSLSPCCARRQPVSER
tara:strand:- start:1738 stop:2109 length:372 start_codon:yes stop_codon:yes gene_type:complete